MSMRVYGDRASGNCLKVMYTADHLGLPYAWVDVDVLKGGARVPSYLAKFPHGQVPGLEIDDGRCLGQSNAIIRFLARGSALLPDDAFVQAKIDEWLFWEQYSHEPYIAVCRFHMHYLGKPKETREPARVERGDKALDLMEAHFERCEASGKFTPTIRPYLVGGAMTIADIALFAYTRVAHEGGFDLTSRPNVRAWIARCEKTLKLEN